MSKIKIGINGFGRIGRMVLRASLNRDDIQIVGINDLLDVEHLAYLLKYDSVHGTCNANIETKNGHLIVDGNEIRISAERDPKQIGWDSINVDVALECTGIFTSLAKAAASPLPSSLFITRPAIPTLPPSFRKYSTAEQTLLDT